MFVCCEWRWCYLLLARQDAREGRLSNKKLMLNILLACVTPRNLISFFCVPFFSDRALRRVFSRPLWCFSCWLCWSWASCGWHQRSLTMMQPVWSHSMVSFLRILAHLYVWLFFLIIFLNINILLLCLFFSRSLGILPAVPLLLYISDGWTAFAKWDFSFNLIYKQIEY